VFDDADIESAIGRAIVGTTANSGQVCAVSSQVYIQDTILHKWLEHLKVAFQHVVLLAASHKKRQLLLAH
jgi:aldehyde dehydrogenase (NAD+)